MRRRRKRPRRSPPFRQGAGPMVVNLCARYAAACFLRTVRADDSLDVLLRKREEYRSRMERDIGAHVRFEIINDASFPVIPAHLSQRLLFILRQASIRDGKLPGHALRLRPFVLNGLTDVAVFMADEGFPRVSCGSIRYTVGAASAALADHSLPFHHYGSNRGPSRP